MTHGSGNPVEHLRTALNIGHACNPEEKAIMDELTGKDAELAFAAGLNNQLLMKLAAAREALASIVRSAPDEMPPVVNHDTMEPAEIASATFGRAWKCAGKLAQAGLDKSEVEL